MTSFIPRIHSCLSLSLWWVNYVKECPTSAKVNWLSLLQSQTAAYYTIILQNYSQLMSRVLSGHASRGQHLLSKLSRALWWGVGGGGEGRRMRESRCEMLIGGDNSSNGGITLAHVFQCWFTFALVCASRWLADIWSSLVDWDQQGKWRRWNSNSRDVVASSPSFCLHVARVSWRAARRLLWGRTLVIWNKALISRINGLWRRENA